MITEPTHYKDCNDLIINYGDILRLKDYKPDKSPYAPKEPFCIFTKKGIYISGMDEFVPIIDCKLKTDKIDELKAFEIVVPKAIYDDVMEDS